MLLKGDEKEETGTGAVACPFGDAGRERGSQMVPEGRQRQKLRANHLDPSCHRLCLPFALNDE